MKNIEKAIEEINNNILEFNRWANLVNTADDGIGYCMEQAGIIRRIIYAQIQILNLLDDEHMYEIHYTSTSKYADEYAKMKDLVIRNTEV